MINNYKKINKVAASSGNDQEERMDEDEQQEEQRAVGIRSGGSPGSGATVQNQSPLFPALSQKSVVMTYSNRSCFRTRNFTSTPWTSAANTTNDSVTRWAINSDYVAIPSHTLGMYMTGYELHDLVYDRFRTWCIKEASFEIEGIQVFQNTQLGGTDLRWGTFLGVDPQIYIPRCNGKMWPSWWMREAPAGPGGADTFPGTVYAGRTHQQNAKNDIAPMAAMSFMYIGDVHLGATVHDGGSGNVGAAGQAFGLRDTDIMAVTNLKGYRHSHMVWPGCLPNMGQVIRRNQHASSNTTHYNGNTHEMLRGTFTPNSFRTSVEHKRQSAPKGVWSHDNAGLNPARLDLLKNIPVGSLWNHSMHTITGKDGTMIPGESDNMPFMFRLQDINDPDNKPQDYTVVIFVRSNLVIEYNTDHIGGNNVPAGDGTGAAILANFGKYAHSMYGKGGFFHTGTADEYVNGNIIEKGFVRTLAEIQNESVAESDISSIDAITGGAGEDEDGHYVKMLDVNTVNTKKLYVDGPANNTRSRRRL